MGRTARTAALAISSAASRKRLEQGRFAWPGIEDGMIRLSKGQFEALFEGLDWRLVRARPVRRPLAAE